MSTAIAFPPSSDLMTNFLECSFFQVSPEIRFLTHDMAFGFSLLRASHQLHLSVKWVWWDRGLDESADIFIFDWDVRSKSLSAHDLSEESFNCLVVDDAWDIQIKPKNSHCLFSKSLGARSILEKAVQAYNLRNFQ